MLTQTRRKKRQLIMARVGILLALLWVQAGLSPQSRAQQNEAPQAQSMACRDILLEEEPFLITSVTENRQETYLSLKEGKAITRHGTPSTLGTEVFWADRSAKNGQGRKLIARGSLVRLAGSTPEHAKHVYVEVLKTHATYSSRMDRVPFAKAKERGFVIRESLSKPGSDDALVVTRDTSFYSRDSMGAAQEIGLPAGSGLVPQMEGDRYRAQECCQDRPQGPRRCEIRYLYEILTYDRTQSKVTPAGELALALACSLDDFALRPLQASQHEQIAGLHKLFTRAPFARSDFDLGVDFSIDGRARYPVGSEAYDSERIMYHYVKNARSRNQEGFEGVDTWGRPQLVCTLKRLLRDWKERCRTLFDGDESDIERCIPMIGDMGFITDGPRALGHASHHHGQCFDMRPFRKDPRREGGVSFRSFAYDRDLTEKFIDFLIERGPDTILFNDSRIENNLKRRRQAEIARFGTIYRRYNGHDNHLHVCFSATGRFEKVCTQRPEEWPPDTSIYSHLERLALSNRPPALPPTFLMQEAPLPSGQNSNP